MCITKFNFAFLYVWFNYYENKLQLSFQTCFYNNAVTLYKNNYSSGLCGGHFMDADGHLSSPSYPRQYPAHKDCVYTISQSNGKFLQLAFQVFHLDAYFCEDYVEIRDGTSAESRLIGKFCHENIPAIIQSTQNNVWIR